MNISIINYHKICSSMPCCYDLANEKKFKIIALLSFTYFIQNFYNFNILFLIINYK